MKEGINKALVNPQLIKLTDHFKKVKVAIMQVCMHKKKIILFKESIMSFAGS